eukprot:m51a1_g13774 hypothetical protein (744) ;mRNA; f:277471-280321
MKRTTVEISGDLLEITPLGAGNEVGRSCVLVRFKGKTVMFDCGIHPAFTGMQSLPWFDTIEDAGAVDLVLVTHFHLDHCASLPYFVERTAFKGRVFMTHPTAAIGKLVLSDFCKMSGPGEDQLYTEQDLAKTMDKVEKLDYHQQMEHNGIKFWCYNAGHVLGAAMFVVEIAGIRILYTGDFSRHEDRHLMGAETPQVPIDVLIVESTYGIQTHEPREVREKRFTGWIDDIVKAGGKCLIPVFALGRAQELLLILDDHWQSHPELHNIRVWYASNLTKKCMTYYQTYTNMMNARIRQQFTVSNPFVFKHIDYLNTEEFDQAGASVVMASPGTLQSGASRELFEKICGDPKNGVIIPGFCVEGSLAKRLLNDPRTVPSMAGREIARRCKVHCISFSAHSDSAQTSQFIDIVKPPYVILVHGESGEMGRLKQSLSEKFRHRNISVFMPKNCQAVKIPFHPEKTKVTVVGELAAQPPTQQRRIGGVLVGKDFSYRLMDARDLNSFTQLKTNRVRATLKVPYHYSLRVLAFCLGQIYADVSLAGSRVELYDSKVELVQEEHGSVVARWQASPMTDMVVDSAVSIALRIESNPLSVKDIEAQMAADEASKTPADEGMLRMLRQRFGSAQREGESIVVTVDNKSAAVALPSFEVSSEEQKLRDEVEAFVRNARQALEAYAPQKAVEPQKAEEPATPVGEPDKMEVVKSEEPAGKQEPKKEPEQGDAQQEPQEPQEPEAPHVKEEPHTPEA